MNKNIYQLSAPSPSRRILLLVFVKFVLMSGYFITQHYYFSLKEAQSVSLLRLSGIANTLSLQIDGDAHEVLMNRYRAKDAITHKEQDTTYQKIHALLKENLLATKLNSPIYTVIYDSLSQVFEFGVTSSDEPYFRHAYTSFPDYLRENYKKGGTIPLYKDEFGSWLSAFAPIKNKKGQVVGIVQVDENFNALLAYIKKVTISNLGVSIVAMAGLFFLLIHFLSKILAKEQADKKALAKAYMENEIVNEKLRESELKLKVYAQKLEKSNQDLLDFAHIASHDLKAPVRSILSFAQLFEKRNQTKFDDRDNEYFRFIKKGAQQSLMLIEGLLNYSKVDKNIGTPVEVAVNEAIETAQSNLKSFIEERNAVIICQPLPVIKAHPLLIAQLFQNLINNGIKYNTQTQPIIEIKAEQSDEGAHIFSVKDNGIGIAEENKEAVFAMFRRLHTTSEYEGSGIGLAFCCRIIETYQGRIWLDSTLGEGTTFYFTLPDTFIANSPEEYSVEPQPVQKQ